MKIEIGYQAFVVMGTSCDVLSEKIFSVVLWYHVNTHQSTVIILKK